jgi:hypothetical protein
MRRLILMVIALAVAASPALAHTKKKVSKKVFKVDSVVMYQPASVVADRVGDPGALKDYEHRLEHDLRAGLAAAPRGSGFSAAMVVVVRPGQGAHVWLVSKADIPSDLAGALTAAAVAEPAVDVQGGPIAFAVVFDGFGGGGPKVVDKQHPIPIPDAWTQAVPTGGEVATNGLELAR